MPSMARGLTSDGAITWVKPASRAWSIAEVDQRELELGADAGEEVEARARHLGAALEVDRAEHPAELDVVARLEVELARRADRLEHDEVVLAAGRRLVGGEVGDRHQRRLPLLLGVGLGGLGGLDLGGERPWCGASSACFSSPCACGISLPSCFCSARLASKSAIAAGGRRRRPAPGPRRRRTGRAWPGRRARGRGRRGARRGSIIRGPCGEASAARLVVGWGHAQGYPSTRSCGRCLGYGLPGILTHRCSTAPATRHPELGAVSCFALFGVLAVPRHPRLGARSTRFDNRGDAGRATGPTRRRAGCTAAAVHRARLRHHRDDDPDRRRWSPACCSAGTAGPRSSPSVVMVATSLLTTVIKVWIGRGRPAVAGHDRPAQHQLASRPGTPRRSPPSRRSSSCSPSMLVRRASPRRVGLRRCRRCWSLVVCARPGAAGPALPHRRHRRRRCSASAMVLLGARRLQPAAPQPRRDRRAAAGGASPPSAGSR